MSKKIVYPTSGVCSQAIMVEVDGDIVIDVMFVGGCQGNTQGVARLAKGMKVDDVIARLEGIDCNRKGTSCPDQLARALKSLKSHTLRSPLSSKTQHKHHTYPQQHHHQGAAALALQKAYLLLF